MPPGTSVRILETDPRSIGVEWVEAHLHTTTPMPPRPSTARVLAIVALLAALVPFAA